MATALYIHSEAWIKRIRTLNTIVLERSGPSADMRVEQRLLVWLIKLINIADTGGASNNWLQRTTIHNKPQCSRQSGASNLWGVPEPQHDLRKNSNFIHGNIGVFSKQQAITFMQISVQILMLRRFYDCDNIALTLKKFVFRPMRRDSEYMLWESALWILRRTLLV